MFRLAMQAGGRIDGGWASSPPRHGTVEVPKDGGGVAAALSGKDLKIVDAAVFWPLQSDPLFRLTGVFPFPSSDHRLV
jgi:hypothetical protein